MRWDWVGDRGTALRALGEGFPRGTLASRRQISAIRSGGLGIVRT